MIFWVRQLLAQRCFVAVQAQIKAFQCLLFCLKRREILLLRNCAINRKQGRNYNLSLNPSSVMDKLSHEQKLRATIYYDVRKVCFEALQKTNFTADRDVVDLVAELVWKKLQIMAQDLELFAKHGKRMTVNAEDVKLTLRALPSLKATITQMTEEQVKKKHSIAAPEAAQNELERSEIQNDNSNT